jgi:putative Holliday junction resolvase
MGKIMALDVGRVRIGIAISDPLRIIASPYENYKRKNIREDIAHIKNIIISSGAEKAIIGLPVSMDGTLNQQCQSIMGFAEELKKEINIPVEFTDERFSSVAAESVLIEADVSRKDRKNLTDKLAAAIFLQSYIDNKNNK